MTPREIVLANLNHENPPRPGMNFSGDRMNDFLGGGISKSAHYEQKRWVKDGFEYYDDEWGNVWYRKVEGSQGGEIYEQALKDWSQLESLRLPDYDNPERYKDVRQRFGEPTDKFKMAWIPGWVFATSRYLRKMEIYFMDLIEYREEIDQLHEKVTDLFVKMIHLYGEAGADGIFYCEDLGVQDRVLIGPRMWREIFKPHYERLTSAAHEHGMKVLQHSCGYNWELVDDLVAAGVDCFQFDQPHAYDMPALAEKLKKHKVALYSPVDIQQIMPTGDRALIESEARRMVELFGGFFIAKNYGDLAGIGVKPEWDQWAYEAILAAAGVSGG